MAGKLDFRERDGILRSTFDDLFSSRRVTALKEFK
jgi:hypothetical protein